MRKQRIALKHHGDIALTSGEKRYIAPADEKPPSTWLFQSGNHAEKRCLPATRGTEQGHQRATFNDKIKRLHRLDFAVALANAFKPDFGGLIGHYARPPIGAAA